MALCKWLLGWIECECGEDLYICIALTELVIDCCCSVKTNQYSVTEQMKGVDLLGGRGAPQKIPGTVV